MQLNIDEQTFIEDLEGCTCTKEQADAFLQLDREYHTLLLKELRETFNLRLNSYGDGRFVEIDGQYIKFEDLLLYLMSIGYINIADAVTDPFADNPQTSKKKYTA